MLKKKILKSRMRFKNKTKYFSVKEKKMKTIRQVWLILLFISISLFFVGCASYMDWYYTTLPGGKEQHDRQAAEINSRYSGSTSSGKQHSFMYNEWPDGCLTMPFGQGHYDRSGRHRNDNSQVRSEIEFFNNWVRQNNAIVTSDKSQEYSPGVGTRSSEIYTNIILVATSR